MIVAESEIFDTYGGLIDALVRLRKRRHLAQNALDDRSGLQTGYVGKLENWQHPRSGRGVGPVTLELWLQGLNAALVLVERKPVTQCPVSAEEQLTLELVGGGIVKPPQQDRRIPLDMVRAGRDIVIPPTRSDVQGRAALCRLTGAGMPLAAIGAVLDGNAGPSLATWKRPSRKRAA